MSDQNLREKFNSIPDGKRYINTQFKVSELRGFLDNNTLVLKNDFQREVEAWDIKESLDFVTSVKDGYPVPSICIYYDENLNAFSLIDGLQRMNTIKKFFADEIPNSSNINPSDLNKALIPVILFKGTTEELIALFEKINTTGSKVNNQELRRSKYKGSKIRNWIENKELSDFNNILTGNLGTFSEKQKIRQLSEEFILWLLMPLRGENITEVNTDKQKLDLIYSNSEAPTDEEWSKIINLLKKIEKIIGFDVMLIYKKKITPKAYLLNIFYLLYTDFFGQQDEKKIAERLSSAFKKMGIIEEDPDSNTRPYDQYKISRTTIAKDRKRSLNELKKYL